MPGHPLGTIRSGNITSLQQSQLVEEALCRNRAEIAAVIVEPVAGNMGVVPPAKGFLQKLRKLTREHGRY